MEDLDAHPMVEKNRFNLLRGEEDGLLGVCMGFLEPETRVEDLGVKLREIAPKILDDILGILTTHLETTLESEKLTEVLQATVRGILTNLHADE